MHIGLEWQAGSVATERSVVSTCNGDVERQGPFSLLEVFSLVMVDISA